MKTVGVGVVGLGLMGRVHVEAYRAAHAAGSACRLVGVSDRDRARLDGRPAAGGNLQAEAAGVQLFDPRSVRTCTDPLELFADPEVELVSICTPTDTHVALAEAALRAGKNVLLEKPVSLEPAAVRHLIEVEHAAARFCMPAMCMRFWPGWSWLIEAARDGRYGRIVGATFQRLASRPTWGAGFYADASRSGGALFDLHVHDVDFLCALCGVPRSVIATGSLDHVTTTYRFDEGSVHVTAEGGWDQAPGFPFRMRYVANFERATAEFDSRRDSPLEIAPTAPPQAVDRNSLTGYDLEIRHALECVSGGGRPSVGLADSERVTRILVAERESLEQRIERSVS